MKKIEIIASLLECMEAAIKSGDWKVDGACDPDMHISIAEAKLEQEGMHRDLLTGTIWVKDE